MCKIYHTVQTNVLLDTIVTQPNLGNFILHNKYPYICTTFRAQGNWPSYTITAAVVLLNVLGCRLTYYGQAETNA